MFQPGISGNTRGRPRGSLGGRAQVLAALDRMLSKECNQQALIDAIEKGLQADPVRLFRDIVVPLLPRSTREVPPPDANDDWLPLDRTPRSVAPLGICSPPKRPSLPPTPTPDASLPVSPSSPPIPHPSILSLTCYLLLLIPFGLKQDQVPHPARTLVHAVSDRLSRIVCVSVKGPVIRDPRPCQPTRKELCRLRMNVGAPRFILDPRVHSLDAQTRLILVIRCY